MMLSKRLQTVADMIPPSDAFADIGCDHGYLPIYLVNSGKAARAIAMDLRKGPLERARAHVHEYGLEGKIDLRLSDGADALYVKDAVDTIAVTGMGGRLLLRIMERGHAVFRAARDIFVSPQSDIPLVRRKITTDGFTIVDETMVQDAGKYYVILHLKPVSEGTRELPKPLSDLEVLYGACIHTKKDPVLVEFLQKEQKQTRKILNSLTDTNTKAAQAACEQAERKLGMIEQALQAQQIKEDENG